MSTETPDAEAAWQEWASSEGYRSGFTANPKTAFLAGRESLAARLDALREQLDANRSSDDQATLDRLHAENAVLRQEIEGLVWRNQQLTDRLEQANG